MSLTYCGNLVCQQDPDRLLLSLLSPRGARPALWALYAFNYEIAKTREVVSETTTGLIRLTWWREAVAEIYAGRPRQHEVVMALSDAIRQFDLPQEQFETMIYAREFDVEDRVPATLEGLFHYADYTTTPLSELSLKILGQSDEGAREASIRYAVTGLLRATPYLMRARRCYLPEDVLAAHGTSSQRLFDFNKREKLPGVVEEIIAALPYVQKTASAHLNAMNHLSSLHEVHIRKAKYDVFHPIMMKQPTCLALRVFMKNFLE